MAMRLEGSCRCGAISFSVDSHTPYPYQRCYCSIGRKGSADRHYCKRCGTPLWVSDEQWPKLVHPFALAIDTELPKAPSSVHLLLRDKASWVEPQIGPNDYCFDGYPELSIEEWHKKQGLWIE